MYQWSDTDLMFRDAIRGFIDKEIRPHVDKLETGELPPFDIIRKLFATFGIDEMARDALEKSLARERGEDPESAEKGEKSAGLGAGSMGVIMNAELAGVSLGLVASLGVSLGLAAGTIRSRGTLAQKERWLPGLVTFEKVGAWAITEPDSGSDAFGGMKSYVRRDGDDYILNGQKTFITNGPYADVMIVYAKLDDGDASIDRRDRKVLTFVLDAGMEGLTQGAPFKKMGMNSSPTGELFFDNVRVGCDRLLGETEEGGASDGKSSAKESFAAERIGIASLSLGIINECHRLCVDYAKSRKLWGKEIAQFQLVQLKLAEMEIARMNVQNMVFNAIERAEAGTR